MFNMTQGVCKDEKDLDVFFPDDDGVYDRAGLRYAKFVCLGCPVRDLCREEGLTGQLDTIGVWGGLTEKERRRVAKGTDKRPANAHALAMAEVANRERSQMATDHNLPYYIKALEEQGKGMPAEFRTVLEIRIANPKLSFAELGKILGMTKDGVAGKLRRVKESVISGKRLNWESNKGIKYGPRKKAVLE